MEKAASSEQTELYKLLRSAAFTNIEALKENESLTPPSAPLNIWVNTFLLFLILENQQEVHGWHIEEKICDTRRAKVDNSYH